MSEVDWDIPILLIDDDAMVRGILIEYLHSFGFKRVIDTKDPQKALKIIQDPKIQIALILSDWEMPGLTGLTLLRAVRNAPHRRHTKFIMITSQQSMERFKVTQAAQWRVSSYMVKPFQAEALKERIFEVLGWEDTNSKKSG
jgi:two-component system, chemotaxis family, chemotaxis protein CheY